MHVILFSVGAGLMTAGLAQMYPNLLPWNWAFWVGWGCGLLAAVMDLRRTAPKP